MTGMCPPFQQVSQDGAKAGKADAQAGRPRAASPVSGAFAAYYDEPYAQAYAANRSAARGGTLGQAASAATGREGDALGAASQRPTLKALLG